MVALCWRRPICIDPLGPQTGNPDARSMISVVFLGTLVGQALAPPPPMSRTLLSSITAGA
jgi:hypothetical protein